MSPPRRQLGPGPATSRVLSRRDVLRGLAVGSVALGLAACGSSTSPSGAAGSPGSSGASGTSGGTGPSGVSGAGGSSGASSGSAAPSAPGSAVPSAISALPLRQKIGRLLVVGFKGTAVSGTSAIGSAIAGGEIGGVILFDRNITSPTQLAGLTGALADLAPADVPLLISVDQEGGKVLRLGPDHGFPDVPSQQAVGAMNDADAAALYASMAATLANAGINLNLAPDVDVNINPKSAAIGALQRSFSADPAIVTTMARTAVQAHHAHGVLTTLKHFPGIGSGAGNTDTGVVDITKTWSERELGPFRDLVASGDADVIMVGHAINRSLDAKYPTSLSKATINGLLRGDIGWDGPVITDDLQAAAITKRYKQSDAVAAALNAGVDLLLFAAPTSSATYYRDLVTSIEALVTSGKVPVGRIDEAVQRVEMLRAQL